MEVLELLKRSLKTCVAVLKFGAGIQEKTRKALVKDLQLICLNCDKAYDVVLKRLAPIKDSFNDPPALATELRSFAADSATRKAFKPEHLCGEIDQLTMRLESNLDPLKYSIDRSRIRELRVGLGNVGNYDAAIYRSFDEFRQQLDALATQIQSPAFDAVERAEYARRIIQDFESELLSVIEEVRKTKGALLAKNGNG